MNTCGPGSCAQTAQSRRAKELLRREQGWAVTTSSGLLGLTKPEWTLNKRVPFSLRADYLPPCSVKASLCLTRGTGVLCQVPSFQNIVISVDEPFSTSQVPCSPA